MDADAVPSTPSSLSVAAMPPSCHVVRQRPSSANRSASVTAAASSNVATTIAPGTAPGPPLAIKVPRVRPIRVISLNADAAHFRINVSTFISVIFFRHKFRDFAIKCIRKKVLRKRFERKIYPFVQVLID